MARTSAALLLYRCVGRDEPTACGDAPAAVEVLLGHMGGPFWARRDAGAWTVPKGELDGDEDPHAAALREFAEELGVPAPASACGEPDLDLGEIRQRSGKRVVAWARRGTLDVTTIVSNTAVVQWPPRSGRTIEVPELDRAAWFGVDDARRVLVSGQSALVDRLVAALGAADA